MTPEAIQAIFDANAIIIMFAWGLLHKYLPFLKAVPNTLIPWVNMVGYILVRFAVPDAHGAGLTDSIPSLIGVLIGGFTNAIWARQAYEGFGRGLLERWLKIKKPA